MVKILRELWGINQDKLKKALVEHRSSITYAYQDLVKLAFKEIYNDSILGEQNPLELGKITVIDDGDYQGTLLFAIPFNSYQPCAGQYIMTFIEYGSCSGCDALQAALDGSTGDQQITDLMAICKDLICNTVKPFNHGWRHEEYWAPVEFE